MMWCVHAEQVVAAVVGGSEHGLVAGPCKDPSGLDQKRQRQRGAIGIENHPVAVAPLQELRNCINEAVPQNKRGSPPESGSRLSSPHVVMSECRLASLPSYLRLCGPILHRT